MMATVTIELPARLFAALQRSPNEATAIEKDVLLAAAIDWYRRGLVCQGRAAEIAGVPCKGITPVPEDLRTEVGSRAVSLLEP
jgi:predicted HTH domain antitoxin